MNTQLKKAMELREQNKAEEAMIIINGLLSDSPDDPTLNYQAAWTCDSMGNENMAAPFYEKAIANGLSGEDLQGALLGLGSTYRCLGLYQKSLDVFNRGVAEFPTDHTMKVFRCLTLYNLGEHNQCTSGLLTTLLDTTQNTDIKDFQDALRYYSDKLDKVWT